MEYGLKYTVVPLLYDHPWGWPLMRDILNIILQVLIFTLSVCKRRHQNSLPLTTNFSQKFTQPSKHQFHRYGITFRAIFPCLFGCNFIFYPQNHKNKILLNRILPDHYTLRISKELAYGKYFFLVLKVALRNHINFDAYFEPLSNNYKTL